MASLPERLVPSQTPAVILAGGAGERLLPLTLSRPKPLFPIGSFRVIDFSLMNCRMSGFTRCSLLTQFRSDQIAQHLSESWDDDFRCEPPKYGRRYRGTADAVFQNLPKLIEGNPRHVLILSADHVYNMDYRKLCRTHVENNADVTVSAIRLPASEATSFGVITAGGDGRVTGFQEKPRLLRNAESPALVSMGIYLFRMETLIETLHAVCGTGAGYDFGRDVLPLLVDSARVYAHNFADESTEGLGYWRDIGTFDSYHAACMDLARPNPPHSLRAAGLPSRAARPSCAGIARGARVWRSMLCSGVSIEEDADVEESVLMPGVRVGAGAKLRRAIVDENVQIPAGFRAGYDLDNDRTQHIVSRGGVVVVTRSAAEVDSVASPELQEKVMVASRAGGPLRLKDVQPVWKT